MKKILQYILIISSLLLTTSCSNKKVESQEENAEIQQTTYLETPIGSRPKSQEPINNIFIALNVLKEAEYYQSETYGEIEAKKKIQLTTQTLTNKRTITPEATFSETKTYSTFVKSAEQFYTTKEKILKRDSNKISKNSVSWNNNISSLSHEQYLEKYGYLSTDPTRYIINENTVLDDIEIITNGIGRKYTYKFNLDPKTSITNYSVSVKNIANAISLPSFESIQVTITFDYKWRISKIETYEIYTVELSGLGKITCYASLTETFSNINKKIDIQEKDIFLKHL